MKNLETIAAISVGGLAQLALQLNTYADTRLDAAADEYWIAFEMTKDMLIDQVILPAPALTGAPVYEVSLMSVDVTNGEPNAILDDGGGEAKTEWTASVPGNYAVVTLDNDYDASAGEVIGIRVRDNQGVAQSPDVSNYMDIRAWTNQYYWSVPLVMTSTDTGSTWTPQSIYAACFAVRNSGDADDAMGFPMVTALDAAAVVTTLGDISAQKFVLPPSLGRRVRIKGAITLGTFSGNFRVGIYDSAGATVVESGVLDNDISGVTDLGTRVTYLAPTWLDTGVELYLGMKLAEASLATSMYGIGCSTNMRSCFAGYPDNAMSVFSSSSWTDVAANIAMVGELLISEWDAHGIEMQHLDAGMSR